jgi:hypothetical protein
MDVDQLAAVALDEDRDLGVLVVAHVGEVEQQVVAHLLLHHGSVNWLTWT